MKRSSILIVLLAATALAGVRYARGRQAPGAANAPDIAISHKDRFYRSDQFSNTVSVIDPMDNKLLGVLRLGDTTPANLSPLYKGQLLVHGMGFSRDHRTLAVVSTRPLLKCFRRDGPARQHFVGRQYAVDLKIHCGRSARICDAGSGA